MCRHLTIALIVLGVLIGCGRKTEAERQGAALERDTGARAHVERTGPNETVVLTENTMQTTIVSGKEVAAPAAYPADGFIPAQAQLKTSVSQGTDMTIVYVIPGPFAAALENSARTLRDRGWLEDGTKEIHSASAFASYSKGAASLSEQFAQQPDGRIEVTQMYVSGR